MKIQHQSELKEHYFKCEEMKKYYGELFNLIVKYNHKNLSIPQKQSLNAIIDMFSTEIQNNINNELKKQGMQPVVPVQQPPPQQPMMNNFQLAGG